MSNRILTLTGKLRVSFFVVLVLDANAHAATATPKANPYSKAIVGRNVFSLMPPSPARIVDPPPLPPPRITLQGVTTMLGRRQVLFKVQMPPKPGEPTRESFYVRSEGEREGEIEVLEIDERAGTVKFKNHGIVVILNLKNDQALPE